MHETRIAMIPSRLHENDDIRVYDGEWAHIVLPTEFIRAQAPMRDRDWRDEWLMPEPTD